MPSFEEQVKAESIAAAREQYGLNPFQRDFPLARLVPLESEQERQRYTHKVALVLAGRPAVVYRVAPGAYLAQDDPGRPLGPEEFEEQEMYRACQCAAGYLEKESGQVGRLSCAVVPHPVGAPYAARWHFEFDMDCCDVVRYDDALGLRYEVLEEEGRAEEGAHLA